MVSGANIRLMFGERENSDTATGIVRQTLTACNQRRLCFLMAAIYCVVNIFKFHPVIF